jgi:exonuclease III
LAAGRHVIITGDVNTSHKRIDHCNADKFEQEYGIKFEEQPSRKWFTSFLVEGAAEIFFSIKPLDLLISIFFSLSFRWRILR